MSLKQEIYLERVLYDYEFNAYIGEFEDGTRLFVFEDDMPPDMSAFDFLMAIREGIDDGTED